MTPTMTARMVSGVLLVLATLDGREADKKVGDVVIVLAFRLFNIDDAVIALLERLASGVDGLDARRGGDVLLGGHCWWQARTEAKRREEREKVNGKMGVACEASSEALGGRRTVSFKALSRPGELLQLRVQLGPSFPLLD